MSDVLLAFGDTEVLYDMRDVPPTPPNKVMKVEAPVDHVDNFAQFDFLSDETDLWVTFGIAVPSPTLALWASADFSGHLVALWNIDTSTSNGEVEAVDVGSGLVWIHSYAQDGTDAPTADQWHTVEFHSVLGPLGETADLYLDGVLSDAGDPDGGPPTDATPHQQIQVGIVSPHVGGEVVYFDNVKVGTTRGGSDVFEDDFADETLDAWTSTTGDVSIVDDPF